MSNINSSEIKLASEMIGDVVSRLRKSLLNIESDLDQIKKCINALNSCNGTRASSVKKIVKNSFFGKKVIHEVKRWKVSCSSSDVPTLLSSYSNNLDLLSSKESELEEIANTLNKMVCSIENELGGGYVRHFLYNNINENQADFKSYDLTDDEVLQLARLCAQEQGSDNLVGILWEASLIANKFELSGGVDNQGRKYDSVVEYARNCGWWADSNEVMNGDFEQRNPVSEETKALVKEVFVNKKRILPKYVDEHDSIKDLSVVKNDDKVINKQNSDEYIPYKTKCIQNSDRIDDGDSWRYVGHPTKDSDPYGYSDVKNVNKYGEFCYDSDSVIRKVKSEIANNVYAKNSENN